ncbi:hypothetical protein OJF2_32030 [Aquisphaera giovannonii]|uniref:Uncharacterized protein n=1 Tax=Aquisphaera giovannonii TaxID=406548 RepID=A0A5B9W1X8_9BACT|nr:hypothetical protein [Aquisphaera giovannonii]QEH34662.1 hypothetical protein OJF2_32030 [Aquisphaera giovannonii]
MASVLEGQMVEIEDMPQEFIDEGGGRSSVAHLDLHRWRATMIGELNASPVRPRLPLALAGLGCIHLLAFLLCQACYFPDGRADLRHPLLWFLELVGVLAFFTGVLGPGWMRSTLAMNLVVKFWTTFLILSFSAVTLNSFTGFELAWYKPIWGTLSTFLLASMAWLFTPWFFVPAVQMWLTGLLIVNLPDYAFLIYGVSWWIALVGIAIRMRQSDLRRGIPGPD